MKIILLQGLPASGKSTWAKEQVKAHPGVFKRINKDDLREMMDASHWSKENEKFVVEARDWLIKGFLAAGKSVIVDDTNLHPKHLIRMNELAEAYNATVEVKVFATSVDECIARDLKRPRSVGERVIKSMYKQFLAPRFEPYNGAGLPKAIIVDIDGTLAFNISRRSPYDWHRVGEDGPNQAVVDLISDINEHQRKYTILLFSGRDEVCRRETEYWLQQQKIEYDQLEMRPAGNMEKDSIVKRRMFDEHVAGKYDVAFVLDDRNQVVELWRSLGLTCLQVADGDF